MTFFATFAASSEIDRVEKAVSRLLLGIEAGCAAGDGRKAYRDALRRHSHTILAHGGPEALEAATDRLSEVPGRSADCRAVLTKLWADLDEADDCDRPADLSRPRRARP